MDAEVGAPASATAPAYIPPAATGPTIPSVSQTLNFSLSLVGPSTNPLASSSSIPATVDGDDAPTGEREDVKGLSDDLGKLLDSGLASDVTFLIGPNKVTIKAHQAILVARSEYFRTMFSAGMQESRGRVVEKPNIEPEVFRTILHYIYTGKVRITAGTIPLLAAADEMQLETFKPLVFAATFEKAGVNHDTIFKYLEDSLHFNCSEILLFCLEYVEANAFDCLLPEKMAVLSIEALRLVLARDDLDIDEETLFERLVQWAKIYPNSTSPREALQPLMDFIRFPVMDPSFIARDVEPLGIVPPELLIEAYKFFSVPDLVKECHRTQPRRRSWSWDAASSSPLVKFEKGVTICSTSDSKWQNAIGSQQFTKGRHYFEIYIAKQKRIDNSWKLNVGVVRDGFDAKKHTVAFGYKMAVPCWCLITGRGETLSHRSPSNGQKVDLWAKKIEFFKNGVSMGVAFNDVDEVSLRPALSVIGESVLSLRFPRPPKPNTTTGSPAPARVPPSPKGVNPLPVDPTDQAPGGGDAR